MADHSIHATLGRVFALFDRATRRQVRRLFAWMLLGAALEMVGTALLVLFLDIVAHPAGVPQRMGWLYEAVAPGSPTRFILWFGVAIAVLFVVKNALLASVIYRQNQFAQEKQAEFSAAL